MMTATCGFRCAASRLHTPVWQCGCRGIEAWLSAIRVGAECPATSRKEIDIYLYPYLYELSDT